MMFFRLLMFAGVIFFSSYSLGIFNLKTKKEGQPNFSGKHWVSVTEACHSCSELLIELKSFCNNKKPPNSRLGFLISGSTIQSMLEKLKDYKQDYEIFSGSPNEFYESYQIMASPSLKTSSKVISGKTAILNFLKKDQSFCSS